MNEDQLYWTELLVNERAYQACFTENDFTGRRHIFALQPPCRDCRIPMHLDLALRKKVYRCYECGTTIPLSECSLMPGFAGLATAEDLARHWPAHSDPLQALLLAHDDLLLLQKEALRRGNAMIGRNDRWGYA